MARKPNYRYERAERERLQAERQARRDLKKSVGRGDAPDAAEQPSREPPEAVHDIRREPSDG
jgi:hypothetical protein